MGSSGEGSVDAQGGGVDFDALMDPSFSDDGDTRSIEEEKVSTPHLLNTDGGFDAERLVFLLRFVLHAAPFSLPPAPLLLYLPGALSLHAPGMLGCVGSGGGYIFFRRAYPPL